VKEMAFSTKQVLSEPYWIINKEITLIQQAPDYPFFNPNAVMHPFAPISAISYYPTCKFIKKYVELNKIKIYKNE
jgi:hypothetical protein